MMPLDDLRVYLPKYLSAENYDQLISQLRDFPANIDKRMFTIGLEPDIIYQGDALSDMPVVSIENLGLGVKQRPCMIVSNTCDMDLNNTRLYPTTMLYTPIVQLNNYIKVLLQGDMNLSPVTRNGEILTEKILHAHRFTHPSSWIRESMCTISRGLASYICLKVSSERKEMSPN